MAACSSEKVQIVSCPLHAIAAWMLAMMTKPISAQWDTMRVPSRSTMCEFTNDAMAMDPATPANTRVKSFGWWNTSKNICRSEEHTSELHSIMRITYADFCLTNKKKHNK